MGLLYVILEILSVAESEGATRPKTDMLALCLIKGMISLDVIEDHLRIRRLFAVVPPTLEVFLGLYVRPVDVVV